MSKQSRRINRADRKREKQQTSVYSEYTRQLCDRHSWVFPIAQAIAFAPSLVLLLLWLSMGAPPSLWIAGPLLGLTGFLVWQHWRIAHVMLYVIARLEMRSAP